MDNKSGGCEKCPVEFGDVFADLSRRTDNESRLAKGMHEAAGSVDQGKMQDLYRTQALQYLPDVFGVIRFRKHRVEDETGRVLTDAIS